MYGRSCSFSISSLSCAPTDIFKPYEIILPTHATEKTIERIMHIKNVLKKIITADEFSISLHVGDMLNTMQAYALLQKHTIAISSIDTPDVRTITAALRAAGEDCLNLNMRGLKTTIGWHLASVTNLHDYSQKVIEGINCLHTHYPLQYIRTSTGAWNRSRIGQRLLALVAEKRKTDKTLAIAIEIDARHQTPDEYFDFVYELNKNRQQVPIYFDLDIGHIAEAVKRHPHKKIEKPEIIIEKLLANKKYSKLIGLISLNQYDHENDETHIALMNGSIDYKMIMQLLGEAGRSGHLSTNPLILAEFSPFEYDAMISTEGINYFHELKKAFYNEAF